MFDEGGLRGRAGRRGESAVVVVRDRFGKQIGVGSGPVWGDQRREPTIDGCARTVIESGRVFGADLRGPMRVWWGAERGVKPQGTA